MTKTNFLALGIATMLSFVGCGKSQKSENVETNKTVEMGTVQLTKALFLEKVANYETHPDGWNYLGDKPALIDFYASWCGPCKMVAPILEELAQEYGDSLVIYKLDTEAEQELAALFGIRTIPSLLFIPMDGQPQMAQGAMSKGDFRKAIDEILLKK
ncbi:MAG: thioredoxin [Phocaeicola sp.]